MSKYNEAMERVAVTEEMKRRIMENVKTPERAKPKTVRIETVKRVLALAACLALVIAGVVIATHRTPVVPPSDVSLGAPTEYQSAKELSKKSGVKIEDLKNLPFEPSETRYFDYGVNLVEIVYLNADETLWYRASKGSGDNSGDYNAYETAETKDVGGVTYTLKGGGGLVNLVLYEKGGRSYAIGSDAGLTWAEIEQMIP